MVMDDPTYPSSVNPTPIAMPSAKLCIASPTRTSTDVDCIPGERESLEDRSEEK